MGALLAALLLATTTTDARPAKKPTRDPRTIGLGKNCKKNSDCKHGAQRCVGPNGQGKTNFLEACYLLSTLRPLRAHKLAELVRIGSEQAACVSGRFELPGGVRQVEVEIGREGRSARVDGKPVRDPDELFGGLATVAFTPDDLAVVKGGPEGRRRLLGRAAQNPHPAHLSDARDYLRALRSRNHLLRQGADREFVASFDAPLAAVGARLRQRRRPGL